MGLGRFRLVHSQVDKVPIGCLELEREWYPHHSDAGHRLNPHFAGRRLHPASVCEPSYEELLHQR